VILTAAESAPLTRGGAAIVGAGLRGAGRRSVSWSRALAAGGAAEITPCLEPT
jgi:hypothetical protein